MIRPGATGKEKLRKNIRTNVGFSGGKNTLQNALQGVCRLYLQPEGDEYKLDASSHVPFGPPVGHSA